MRSAGLDTRYMKVSAGQATLFSVCFTYPDGSGGNLTTTNAATALVDPAFINQLEGEFSRWQGQGIAVAAPEVPLAARLRLLELAGQYGFFRAAALTSEEARSEDGLRLLASSDLLAVNLDEAAALVGLAAEITDPILICQAACERARAVQPSLMLSITAGMLGSWSWDGARLAHAPAYPAAVASTAGAGDAHLAGMIAGLAAGLTLAQAQQLGALTAAVSVTSPHTIHPDLNADALLAFATTHDLPLDPPVRACLAPSQPSRRK
jgi:sugar/nucleoside kinase (ribokinase family)